MKLDNQKLYTIKKRDELIKKLRTEGYSGSDIARMFNLNRSTVSDVVKNKTRRSERK